MDKFGFIFPGQGAQYPNMGKDFYDNFLEYRELLEEAGDILKRNFYKIIFESDNENLKKTKNSQLGIFITSMGMLRVLKKQLPNILPSVCAGLSLGEYSALSASLKISFKDALFLVEKRAEFMKDACFKKKGAMSAVLGLDSSSIEEEIKEIDQIWIANYNTEDQTVISGSEDLMDLASEKLKKKGAKRVIPLKVEGAFHSDFMEEAKERFQDFIKEIIFYDSKIDIVMNVTGKKALLKDIKRYLVLQITNSIKWKDSIHFMEKNVDAFLEIGPSKTLFKMNKKNAEFKKTFSLENVYDLEKLSNVVK